MAELGNTRRVYIVVGDGNTYTALKGEQTNSVNRSAESIDISDKDSGAWGDTMPGKKSLTLDVTVYADNTDAQQKAMLNAFYTDQTVKVFVGKLGEGNTPAEGEMFEAVITSINDTNDAGAVATRSMSLASKGAPTLYPEE
jgi:TP901-1 family phage major tail protein